MEKKGLFVLSIVALMAVVVVATAWAVPGTMNYQGTLIDDMGTPVTGDVIMYFHMYDDLTDGTLLWSEQQTVHVSNGIYNIQLGATNLIDSTVFAGDEVYLEVRLWDDYTGLEVFSPRQRLTSTAYAFQAENAQMLEGSGSADFAAAVHDHAGADITSERSTGSGQDN